ncbi:AIM24 family protein [Cerasicoccus arenae]|uniref:AIM24 family protein n=1 Tax=Cerasicoccus arenae TaxID=424488 RepID=A0A8J3GFA7_9BACT|nr:AIM24 family protein [Cerasicoccus arenae]MBK1858379.1 AIM24 family protein [Cerasicoccus arenae]GHC09906.1 hypothetical protein GCM10007047_29080 [Cerasicoccus arenae]
MSDKSLASFIERTKNQDRGQGLFELENERMLEVNLSGSVWTKMGSMVGYHGQVKFTREGIMSQGLGNLLKKAVSGEGAKLTRAEGNGVVYLADEGKKVVIVKLQNEALVVNGNDILAFEEHITYNIKMMKKVAAMMSGGLFNVRLEGSGLIAFTTHYDPVTLRVTPGHNIITDPNATVAWSGNLEPTFRKDVSLKTFVGRGSGESIQMEFAGDGFVVIQPYEEVYMQHTTG